MTQTEAILKHLQTGQTLTALQCLQNGWGMRCAARIIELRREGHNIITEGKDQWAVYRLVSGVSQHVPASSFTRQGVLLDAPTLAPNWDY